MVQISWPSVISACRPSSGQSGPGWGNSAVPQWGVPPPPHPQVKVSTSWQQGQGRYYYVWFQCVEECKSLWWLAFFYWFFGLFLFWKISISVVWWWQLNMQFYSRFRLGNVHCMGFSDWFRSTLKFNVEKINLQYVIND